MAEGDRLPWQPTADAPGNELEIVAPEARISPLVAEPAPIRPAFPPWTIWDIAVIPGAAVLSIFICSAVAIGIAHSLPAYHRMSLSALAQEPLIIIVSQIASYPLVIALMASIVRRRSGESFLKAIQWNFPGRSWAWFYAGGIVLAFTVEGLAHFLPIPKSLPMDKFFNDVSSAYLMAFFGIAVAPLLEELFFRGMLYPTLRRALGIVIGLTLTAAAFAAIHGAQLAYAWAPILSIFVVGVVLTVIRERTGSVAASVLTHSGYNFTLFSLLWIGSDHFHHLDKLT
jgi:membrane protease YdiL (CAAX protease family)